MKTNLLFIVVIILLSIQSVKSQELSIQTGHSSGITDLVFSPDGKFLASSGEDSKIIFGQNHWGKAWWGELSGFSLGRDDEPT